MSKPVILLLGTCDTKLDELLYIRNEIVTTTKCDVLIFDVGRNTVQNPHIYKNLEKVLREHAPEVKHGELNRQTYNELATTHATEEVRRMYESIDASFNAAIAVGGSSGSTLCSHILRESLPIGVPKLLASTMASGNVAPYVGASDLTLMYSVTDIAGLNFLSRTILANAAAAIAGMAVLSHRRANAEASIPAIEPVGEDRKPRVGLTMFGVTTPGVEAIRRALENEHGCEVLVFHATGAGGRAMETLVDTGQLDAVVDLTTTEVADEVVGGVLSAGPKRLEAAAQFEIPYVVSVGACDMVNFGPRETVPEKFVKEGRKLHVHNASVTLMRTTREENVTVGEFIAKKLRLRREARRKHVKVLLPEGGLSMLDVSGAPFEDREADEALFEAIEKGLERSEIEVLRDKRDINDPGFAERVVKMVMELLEEEL